METKKFTQSGTFIGLIMSAFLIVFVILLINHDFIPDQETYAYALLVLIFSACLLMFYKLTIFIDDTNISFKLGIGIIGKSYEIAEIASCKPVKNSFIYGWGIHKIPKGWLYNVSGLNAIELRFKDSTRVVRIGTDNPDEIAGVITDLIGAESESGNYTPEYKIQSQTKLSIIVLIIIVVVAFGNLYYDFLPTKIDMKETQFEINGAYGFSINYSDISAIDTVSKMPRIEMRTNGFALGKVCKGFFKLKEIGSASLFINFNVTPFVQLIQKNGNVIYFNLKDHQSTIEAFEKIKSRINSTK